MFTKVAVGMQAAGAGMGVVGAYFGAKSQQDSLAFQAEMAELNARVSESQAQVALAAGRREVQRSKLNTAGIKSRQRVSMAANGIALNEGSAQAVLTTTDFFGEVDANTIEANAIRQAWGYRTQAVNQRNDAAMARSARGAINPGMSAVTSFLGAAPKVAADWYAMNKAGAFDQPAQASGSAPTGGGLTTKNLTGFWGM